MSLYESEVEEAAVAYLKALGYTYITGPDLAPDGVSPERSSYSDVLLEGRLRAALTRINDHLPTSAIDEVIRQVRRLDSPRIEENNHGFQRLVREGVSVEVRRKGKLRGDVAWLFDHDDPENNDWLVVNQFTVVEGKNTRRPDIVVFLNGLPIAVFEMKNPSEPKATIKTAWNDLQLYKRQIPALFATNELLVVSDGVKTKVGSLTAGWDWFGPWRTVDGTQVAPDAVPQIKVVVQGLFEKERLLDYLYNFVLWETDDGYIKKIAGYHQYHAVNKAVASTLDAASESGDQRIGVIWHTQGSGKSISMCFYAGKIILTDEMQNPTIVVLTDRNDLDGQLFTQFAKAKLLLHDPPVQAERRAPDPTGRDKRPDLRTLLSVPSGGIIFSTIQKFGLADEERKLGSDFPALTERHNVVVIADEAHRSQYGFETTLDPNTGKLTAGLAKNVRDALPNASYIGFTGTPIEFDDRSTPAVFGHYIDTYTMRQAVEDDATVPIYYEARLARIELPDDAKELVDEEFDEVTEGEEERVKGKLKSRWARLEAMVGTEKRVGLVADDLLEHWDRRLEILDGKAMIVGMSRRICVDLYNAIVKRRPDWHSDDDAEGVIKVVMTGATKSDPPLFHPHIRNKTRLKDIEKRFKNPDDPMKLVIVRDMWLTGFDVPCAHTMYVDKPMQGHGLLQAIARVNRKYKDKPSGLVVDYLGLAEQMKKAIASYGGGRKDKPGVPVELALEVLREKFEVVKAMYHGLDYSAYFDTEPTGRLEALAAGVDHICGLEPGDPDAGKKRYIEAMVPLNKAAGIALHLEGARPMHDEIGFFQAVQRNIKKYTVGGSGKTDDELDAAIRQIVAGAITPGQVIDVFGAAGLEKPDISILSDEFLETVRKTEHENLQLELLKKLINDEIRVQKGRNVIQARKFSEMLERTLLAYQNRTLEAAQVINELINLAKAMRDAPRRGEKLGLDEDEMAFYDALVDHGDVKVVMGDDVLAAIAHDVVEAIRKSVTIDWTKKEQVRARMRVTIKRLLRKHGYPPDKRDEAVVTVLEQAEQRCRDWARAA